MELEKYRNAFENQAFELHKAESERDAARAEVESTKELAEKYELQRDDAWAEYAVMRDLAKAAWDVITNAGHGDWHQESPEWIGAAKSWRDRYHLALSFSSCTIGAEWRKEQDRKLEEARAECAALRGELRFHQLMYSVYALSNPNPVEQEKAHAYLERINKALSSSTIGAEYAARVKRLVDAAREARDTADRDAQKRLWKALKEWE